MRSDSTMDPASGSIQSKHLLQTKNLNCPDFLSKLQAYKKNYMKATNSQNSLSCDMNTYNANLNYSTFGTLTPTTNNCMSSTGLDNRLQNRLNAIPTQVNQNSAQPTNTDISCDIRTKQSNYNRNEANGPLSHTICANRNGALTTNNKLIPVRERNANDHDLNREKSNRSTVIYSAVAVNNLETQGHISGTCANSSVSHNVSFNPILARSLQSRYNAYGVSPAETDATTNTSAAKRKCVSNSANYIASVQCENSSASNVGSSAGANVHTDSYGVNFAYQGTIECRKRNREGMLLHQENHHLNSTDIAANSYNSNQPVASINTARENSLQRMNDESNTPNSGNHRSDVGVIANNALSSAHASRASQASSTILNSTILEDSGSLSCKTKISNSTNASQLDNTTPATSKTEIPVDDDKSLIKKEPSATSDQLTLDENGLEDYINRCARNMLSFIQSAAVTHPNKPITAKTSITHNSKNVNGHETKKITAKNKDTVVDVKHPVQTKLITNQISKELVLASDVQEHSNIRLRLIERFQNETVPSFSTEVDKALPCGATISTSVTAIPSSQKGAEKPGPDQESCIHSDLPIQSLSHSNEGNSMTETLSSSCIEPSNSDAGTRLYKAKESDLSTSISALESPDDGLSWHQDSANNLRNALMLHLDSLRSKRKTNHSEEQNAEIHVKNYSFTITKKKSSTLRIGQPPIISEFAPEDIDKRHQSNSVNEIVNNQVVNADSPLTETVQSIKVTVNRNDEGLPISANRSLTNTNKESDCISLPRGNGKADLTITASDTTSVVEKDTAILSALNTATTPISSSSDTTVNDDEPIPVINTKIAVATDVEMTPKDNVKGIPIAGAEIAVPVNTPTADGAPTMMDIDTVTTAAEAAVTPVIDPVAPPVLDATAIPIADAAATPTVVAELTPTILQTVTSVDKSPFLSDTLNEFLNASSELQISYSVPRLEAEQGLKESEKSMLELPSVTERRNSTTRTNDTYGGVNSEEKIKCIKPKTLAEKRRQMEQCKTQLYNRRMSYVLYNGSKIWVTSEQRSKSCVAVINSRTAPQQLTSTTVRPYIFETTATILSDSYSSVKYKPGPLSRKNVLQNNACDQWVTTRLRLPKVNLKFTPEVGKPIDPIIRGCLSLLDTGIIDSVRCQFALSALSVGENATKPDTVSLSIPYRNEQKYIVVRKSKALPKYLDCLITQKDYELESCIAKIIDDLIRYVEIKEIASSLIKDDDPIVDQNAVTPAKMETRSRAKSPEKANVGKKRMNLELVRLNCKYVVVDPVDLLRTVAQEEEQCSKPFCRLGCVCKSLTCLEVISNHCGQVECMFKCTCPPSATYDNLSNFTRTIDEKAKRNLAKEEREFTQTIIQTGGKTIYVGRGGRERRACRAPKRYDDFVENSDSTAPVVQQTVTLPKPPTPIVRRKIIPDIRIKPCSVRLLSLDLRHVLPLCLAHHQHRCPCKCRAPPTTVQDPYKFSAVSPTSKDVNFNNMSDVSLSKGMTPVKKIYKSILKPIVKPMNDATNITPEFTTARLRPIFDTIKARNSSEKYQQRLRRRHPKCMVVKKCQGESTEIICVDDVPANDKSRSFNLPICRKLQSVNGGNSIRCPPSRTNIDEKKIAMVPGRTSVDQKRKRFPTSVTPEMGAYRPAFDGELKVSLTDDNENWTRPNDSAPMNKGFLRLLPWTLLRKLYLNYEVVLYSMQNQDNRVLLMKPGPDLPPPNFLNIRYHNFDSELVTWIKTNRLPSDKPPHLVNVIISPGDEGYFYITGFCLKRANESSNSVNASDCSAIRQGNSSAVKTMQLTRAECSTTPLLNTDTLQAKKMHTVRRISNEGPLNSASKQGPKNNLSAVLNKSFNAANRFKTDVSKPEQTLFAIRHCTHRMMNNIIKTLELRNCVYSMRKLVGNRIQNVPLPRLNAGDRWLVVSLTSRFDYLCFKTDGYTIKQSDLKDVVDISMKASATLRIRSVEMVRGFKYSNRFSMYCAPNCDDRIFLGPYQQNEKQKVKLLSDGEPICCSYNMLLYWAYDEGTMLNTNPIPVGNKEYQPKTATPVTHLEANAKEPAAIIVEDDPLALTQEEIAAAKENNISTSESSPRVISSIVILPNANTPVTANSKVSNNLTTLQMPTILTPEIAQTYTNSTILPVITTPRITSTFTIPKDDSLITNPRSAAKVSPATKIAPTNDKSSTQPEHVAFVEIPDDDEDDTDSVCKPSNGASKSRTHIKSTISTAIVNTSSNKTGAVLTTSKNTNKKSPDECVIILDDDDEVDNCIEIVDEEDARNDEIVKRLLDKTFDLMAECLIDAPYVNFEPKNSWIINYRTNRFIYTNIPNLGYIRAFVGPLQSDVYVMWPSGKNIIIFPNEELAFLLIHSVLTLYFCSIEDDFQLEVKILRRTDEFNCLNAISSDTFSSEARYFCGKFGFCRWDAASSELPSHIKMTDDILKRLLIRDYMMVETNIIKAFGLYWSRANDYEFSNITHMTSELILTRAIDYIKVLKQDEKKFTKQKRDLLRQIESNKKRLKNGKRHIECKKGNTANSISKSAPTQSIIIIDSSDDEAELSTKEISSRQVPASMEDKAPQGMSNSNVTRLLEGVPLTTLTNDCHSSDGSVTNLKVINNKIIEI